MQIGNLIVRIPQLIFVVIVLGLSGELVASQYAGGSPSITNFAVACGAFGAIAVIVGIVSAFVEQLQGLIMLAIDGLATLFWLAGSIAMAVKLGVHSCSNVAGYAAQNSITNGGGQTEDSNSPTGFAYILPDSYYKKRCQEAQACDAFLFFGLATFIASMVLDAMGARRGKSSRGL